MLIFPAVNDLERMIRRADVIGKRLGIGRSVMSRRLFGNSKRIDDYERGEVSPSQRVINNALEQMRVMAREHGASRKRRRDAS